MAYLMVGPVVLWRLGLTIYPFVRTIGLSLTNSSPLADSTEWIGIRNFTDAFQDPLVRNTLEFTAIFLVFSLALQMAYALGVASLLNQRFRGRGIVRAVNILPWAVPPIVIATAAQWLFNDQYGMIDNLLSLAHGFRPEWLSNPFEARVAVILVDVWHGMPWASLILLAGLQDIPVELYEQAKIDGAGAWRTYWKVVFPLLAPVVVAVGTFVGLYRIVTFDIVYGMTSGGPGSSTSLLAFQAYQLAFSDAYYGYGSAVAVLTFLAVAAFGVFGFLVLKRVQRWA